MVAAKQSGADAELPERGTLLRGGMVMAVLICLAVLLAGAMYMTRLSSQQRDIASDWELHTMSVLDSTAQMRVAAFKAMRGERAYLIARDAQFLTPYRDSLVAVNIAKTRLMRLVADNPDQLERMAKIEGRLGYLTSIMSNMIALSDAGRGEELRMRISGDEGRVALDSLMVDIDRFEAVERNLLRERRAARENAIAVADTSQLLLGLSGMVLLSVGAFASLALRSSIRREEKIRMTMEKRAATDELTGLANRRETFATLDRHMASTRRHRRPLSIAILDIDHFKKVNDLHGHPVGDEVIRRVAELGLEVMREEDLVGRLGGEEFVVLLPDTDADAAMTATDRLRRVVAESAVVLEDGQEVRVTLSAGVAQMYPNDDRNKLVARADDALYRAKSGGRDQVLLAA